MMSIGMSAQELLSKVQERFDSMASFSCDFNQEITSATSTQSIILKGKFVYSKRDKYRIEFNNKIIVSDGVNFWSYDKRAGQIIISRVEDNPLNFSLNSLIFEYPKQCEIIEEPGKIKLIPEDDELGLDYIIIFFDENYLIKKVTLADFDNNIYTFELSNINSSAKVNNGMFVINPPKGVKVIDLR